MTVKMKTRSSVKGKQIHNRYDRGNSIYRRLSLGLPKDLDDFLTAQSDALKISKAEIIRDLIREGTDEHAF